MIIFLVKKINLVIFIFFLFFSFNVLGISKKNSLYQDGKPLEEWSENAGWNAGWLSSCPSGNGSSIAQEIKRKVAKLSWPDFKKFNLGKSKWDRGNYLSAKCSQSEFNAAKNGLYNYIEYLEILVNQKIGKINSNNCMDNLEDLTNKELIECGIEKGWVDEEKGIIDLNNIDNSKAKSDSSKSIETKLEELKKLYDSGLISEEVYEKKQLDILE